MRVRPDLLGGAGDGSSRGMVAGRRLRPPMVPESATSHLAPFQLQLPICPRAPLPAIEGA